MIEKKWIILPLLSKPPVLVKKIVFVTQILIIPEIVCTLTFSVKVKNQSISSNISLNSI